MPEGLSVSEVGKEISEHHHRDGEESEASSSRVLMVIEAVLLAVVAVLAAYSGFAASKWATESSLALARAATARNFASRTQLEGLETKNFDASTFNAWFSAYVAGNTAAMTVAEERFRPNFLVAFNAWIATDPFTNPSAPKGPTYMPEYVQPELAQTDHLDKEADNLYDEGSDGWGGLRRLRPNDCLFGLSAFSGRNLWALPSPSRSHWPDLSRRRDPHYFDRPVAHDAPPRPLIGGGK